MAHKFEVDLTGTKYQTRDGRKVEVFKITDRAIYGIVWDGETWESVSWNVDGLWMLGREDVKDLIPVPQKVTLQECWVTYSADAYMCGIWTREGLAKSNTPKGGYIRHIPAMEVDAND